MLLNLREIIGFPGRSAPFDYEPDLSGAVGGQVLAVGETKARGRVKNIAGVLDFQAEADAVLTCHCARCLRVFDYPVHRTVSATLAENITDPDDENFPLEGDFADLDEVIVTDFLLGIPQRILCSEDCKGLCEGCGSDLNNGPCSCAAPIDPRLAVLGQLLENE